MPDQKRRPTIDPAVADILGNLDKKQADARLPKADRKAKAKERKKATDRLPGRVNFDLPPDLKKQIFDFAEKERIPASQIAAFLLADGLRRLKAGELSFNQSKRPSESPRYDWNLDIEGY